MKKRKSIPVWLNNFHIFSFSRLKISFHNNSLTVNPSESASSADNQRQLFLSINPGLTEIFLLSG